MHPIEAPESLEEQTQRIARRFKRVMEKNPESDPQTILQILHNLELTPAERVDKALGLGLHPLHTLLQPIPHEPSMS